VVRIPRPGLFAAVLAAAALTWWLSGGVPEEEPAAATSGGHIPEYFARNLKTVTMDAQGRPARALQTPHLTRFLDDQSSELETPVLTVYKEGEPPWVIRSERAWVSADGDTAILQGKVRISRDGAPGVRPVQIDTTNLLVRPDDDYAETAEFATLASQGNRASGVGVQAWLGKPNRIKFLSQARGHYEVDTPR
jgi:lipopolysaccharide export system protein LptC